MRSCPTFDAIFWTARLWKPHKIVVPQGTLVYSRCFLNPAKLQQNRSAPDWETQFWLVSYASEIHFWSRKQKIFVPNISFKLTAANSTFRPRIPSILDWGLDVRPREGRNSDKVGGGAQGSRGRFNWTLEKCHWNCSSTDRRFLPRHVASGSARDPPLPPGRFGDQIAFPHHGGCCQFLSRKRDSGSSIIHEMQNAKWRWGRYSSQYVTMAGGTVPSTETSKKARILRKRHSVVRTGNFLDSNW